MLEFKSNTAGKAIPNLAKNNNLNYVDTDEEFENIYKIKPSEFIKENNFTEFRKLESKIL